MRKKIGQIWISRAQSWHPSNLYFESLQKFGMKRFDVNLRVTSRSALVSTFFFWHTWPTQLSLAALKGMISWSDWTSSLIFEAVTSNSTTRRPLRCAVSRRPKRLEKTYTNTEGVVTDPVYIKQFH